MGGTGGGGGGSGKVEYPEYMQTVHESWLDRIDLAIYGAAASNPYSGYTAYPPDDIITLMIQSLDAYMVYLDSIEADSGQALAISTFSTNLQNAMDSDVIPAFEAGMRDINAVQSSAFVIGRALLYARMDDQVADYGAKLTLANKTQLATLRKDLAVAYTDVYRISLIAKKEEYEQQMQSEAQYSKWELDIYQAGANMLAGISGGVVATPPINKGMTALGGAMSGASLGAAVGKEQGSTGYGALLGGILGGVAGYLI